MSLAKKLLKTVLTGALTVALSLGVSGISRADTLSPLDPSISSWGSLGPLYIVPGNSSVSAPKSRMIPGAILGPLERVLKSSVFQNNDVVVIGNPVADSAYEIWKEETAQPEATKQDFLESLIVAGPSGPVGAAGIRGPIGLQGAPGQSGPQGQAGAPGQAGPQGQAGAPGEAGEPGTIGPAGLPGVDGENGSSAYEVWLSKGNTGTEQDFIDSLKVKGDSGDIGVDGLSAYEVWLEAGNKGDQEAFINYLRVKGDTGDAGADGMSAYDVWLAAGNTGTEQDFIDSLKGADGVTEIIETSIAWTGSLVPGNLTCPNNQKISSIIVSPTAEDPTVMQLGVQCKDNGPNNATEGNGGFDPAYEGQISETTFKSAFDSWKFVNNMPDATEEEFVTSLQGKAGLDAFDLWKLDQKAKGNGNQLKLTDFFDSLKGATGSQGLQGLPGASAYDTWKNSLPGSYKGSTSVDAFMEAIRGAQGQAGATGAKGDKGDTGAQGVQGQTGATGATGAVGATGGQGPVGPQGMAGQSAFEVWKASLAPSYKGPNDVAAYLESLRGATGATGSVGATGAKGDKGDTGAQGVQGLIGATGATGATGPQGVAGAKGDTGATGATGAIGPQGLAGSSAFEVWKATVGRSNATVSEFLIAITGPQGPIGVTGATGQTGGVGPAGATGKSAFQLWQESLPASNKNNSFADYMVAITGPKGDAGAQGIQGITGPQGPMGLTGPQGVQGPAGPVGPQGPQGLIGPTGPQGVKGDKGDTGVAGPTGPQGPAGKDGAMSLAAGATCPAGQVASGLKVNSSNQVEVNCVSIQAAQPASAEICVATNGSITWGPCGTKGGTTYRLLLGNG